MSEDKLKSDWNIIQNKYYCRYRIKMDESEKYEHCCTLIALDKDISFRFAPCLYDECPIRGMKVRHESKEV